MKTQTRALVVDGTVRRLMAQEALLKNAGVLVLATAKAEAAPLLARTFRPDVVLLSADLPSGHALELLAELQANPKTAEVPVVLMSERPEAMALEALEAGAAAVVRRDASRLDVAAVLSARKASQPLLGKLLRAVRTARMTGTLSGASKTAAGSATFEDGALVDAAFAGYLGDTALAHLYSAPLGAIDFAPAWDDGPGMDIDVRAPWDMAA